MLASGSPRRLRLLRALGFDPVVRVPEVDERRAQAEPYDSYTRRLSRSKADQVAAMSDVASNEHVSPWVVAADTVVVLDGDLLEKPTDGADARHMLRRLSGKQHRVITSFTVRRTLRDALSVALAEDSSVTRTVETDVWFTRLSDDAIDRYVTTGEPLDKAGAYGIQNVGAFLVESVRGSYSAVVGLPLCELVETLVELGAVSGFPFVDRQEGR